MNTVYFDSPVDALEEAHFLCQELGMPHAIVHGYIKEKRNKFSVVRRDKLLNMNRIVAVLTPPKW